MIYGLDMIEINAQVKKSGINQLMNGSHLVLYLLSSGKIIYGLDMIEINVYKSKRVN